MPSRLPRRRQPRAVARAIAAERPPWETLLLLAAVLATLCVLLLSGCATSSGAGGAAYVPDLRADRLINLSLSPQYASWLVGPIARLATPEERQAYLALTDDAEAQEFIDEFWARRDPYPQRPDNPLRETFEKRAQVADRLYSEGGYLGRRTARGTIYVLYGKPDGTDYQIAPNPRDPSILVWLYDPSARQGLDGRPPADFYRFIRRDDVYEFYRPLTGIDARRPRQPDL